MANYRDYIRRKRALLHKAQKGLCYYCRRPMRLAKGAGDARQPPHLATLNHIVPKSKGGTIAENIVAACFTCNNERGDRDARMFLFEKQGLI